MWDGLSIGGKILKMLICHSRNVISWGFLFFGVFFFFVVVICTVFKITPEIICYEHL